MYDKISEDRIKRLHPKIREEVLALLNQAETLIDKSLRIRVVQGLRTIEEQNALFNQPKDGKDNDGDGKVDEKDERVTNAKGGSSYHNYGLAIDICWLVEQPDDSYKYDSTKSWNFGPNYRKIIKLFKDAGYVWGGDWVSIKDTPHFEKRFGLTWKQLYKKYQNKDTFKEGEINYVNL